MCKNANKLSAVDLIIKKREKVYKALADISMSFGTDRVLSGQWGKQNGSISGKKQQKQLIYLYLSDIYKFTGYWVDDFAVWWGACRYKCVNSGSGLTEVFFYWRNQSRGLIKGHFSFNG